MAPDTRAAKPAENDILVRVENVVKHFPVKAGGFVKSPLFVAIVLVATSLGVIVPVLKDSGNISTSFGQLVIAAASIADFGAIILLSLFFSGKGSTSTAGTLILLGVFGLVVLLVGLAIAGAEHSMSLTRVLQRLQDTTAQIRVRAAFLLLIGFTALAENVGLETILGAFAAGALLSLIDRAVADGWDHRRACSYLELDEGRAWRWRRRRDGGRLGDQKPGSAVHGLRPQETAAILELFETWGDVDRSHRKLAHRGSYIGKVWVSPSTVRRVLAAQGLHLKRPRRVIGQPRRPFPEWADYQRNSIWIYDVERHEALWTVR